MSNASREEKYQLAVLLGLDSGAKVLDPVDIQEIYFIEDIFSYCMTGKIIFQDTLGITEYGPLTGNERIMLFYGDKYSRKLLFDIVKMDKITMMSPTIPTGSNKICMYFVDTTFRNSTKFKYSKSWKNTKITEILEDIITNMIEGDSTNEKVLLNEGGRYEKTDDRIDFVMPYWTPMEAISYLNKLARPKSNPIDGKLLGGYLYYNNTRWPGNTVKNIDNNFTPAWISINGLFSYPAGSKNDVWKDQNDFVFSGGANKESQDTATSEQDKLNIDSPTYVNKILEWEYDSIDTILTNKLQGAHVLGYNFDGKKLIDKSFKYTLKNDKENTDYGLVDEATLLGKKSLFSNISGSNSEIILTGLTNDKQIKDKYFYDWLRRYSKQQVLDVMVRGTEERFAGRMVNVIWPSAKITNLIGNINTMGTYIIKSVTHSWGTRSGYVQRLILLKNAYHDSECISLIDSKINNIDNSKSVAG